ncbi:hypothetical protein CDAR_614311 [Caerostris darwini]|uniref:Uncharacterized protein n=1 Tax=Caerostris darwini TaxID=1538125 RepID=A0AAV4MBL6_9ARAC|nr:hypothetical protein CDAR_614311 [Caerostris darwini]
MQEGEAEDNLRHFVDIGLAGVANGGIGFCARRNIYSQQRTIRELTRGADQLDCLSLTSLESSLMDGKKGTLGGGDKSLSIIPPLLGREQLAKNSSPACHKDWIGVLDLRRTKANHGLLTAGRSQSRRMGQGEG